MYLHHQRKDNLYSLRDMTASKLESMNTYNYRGFVGHVYKKGDYYIVSEVTGVPNITGSGNTIEEALFEFEKSVLSNLRETSKDSQKKMVIRLFRNSGRIQSKVRSMKKPVKPKGERKNAKRKLQPRRP